MKIHPDLIALLCYVTFTLFHLDAGGGDDLLPARVTSLNALLVRIDR